MKYLEITAADVGATLVVAPIVVAPAPMDNQNDTNTQHDMVISNDTIEQNDENIGKPSNVGQPQGIAPTEHGKTIGQHLNDEQTQGFAHDKTVGQPLNVGQPQGIVPREHDKTVGDMMDAFKSISTVEYIRGVKNLGWQPFNGKLWQRNYYEHIIRNEQSYQIISNYIVNNPANWKNDKFYQ